MLNEARPAWTVVAWRLLVTVDVVIVTVFAVVAATDPNGVLDQEGVDLQNFRGLLPTATVVALRSSVLAAERYLLPVARGKFVLAERLASAAGFYYAGVWLFERQYQRWVDVILGGTLGYALVGLVAVGVAAIAHAVRRMTTETARPGQAGRYGRRVGPDHGCSETGASAGCASHLADVQW